MEIPENILPKATLLTILNSFKKGESMETQIALIEVAFEEHLKNKINSMMPQNMDFKKARDYVAKKVKENPSLEIVDLDGDRGIPRHIVNGLVMNFYREQLNKL